ncbi:MAG: hypothetical protein Q4C13_09235, partial [Clostridia bacterium]|nr:hypothetical protein [Clostridia bacterium]
YPCFVDGYRVLQRIMERDGISSCLLLCSLTDAEGALLEDRARITPMAQKFAYALRCALRKSDMYTRYGGAQFLLLLWGMSPDQLMPVEARIRAVLDAQAPDENGCGVRFHLFDEEALRGLRPATGKKK